MTRPLSLPSPWLELANAHGTLAALALRIGVQPLAVWRWAHGHRHPGTLAQRRVNELCREARIRLAYPRTKKAT
jgi:hypothetical protein